MTMIDDDTLATLFARAAETFEVPATGATDIVARARATSRTEPRDGEDDASGTDMATTTDVPDGIDRGHEPTVLRRVAAAAGRHRILSVAACIILVLALAGAVGALVRSPSEPTSTSSLAKIPRQSSVAAPSTTTTFPRFSPSNSDATGAGAGAPAAGSTSNGLSAQGALGTNSSTAPQLPNGAVGQSAKIEQTGSLGLQVGHDALSKTMTALTNLASTFGGFVADSQTQSGAGTGGAPFGTITLQVPVQNFSAALKQAQTLGKTTSLSTKATDVTGQYVDLQSRITALQDSRQQYLTIMSKATTVGDVLAVQAQLDAIQSQIEQLQGQLQVLTSETSYSTLTVTASEGSPPPRPAPLPESGLVRAWHQSLGGFAGDVEGLIRVAGPALFALLCLAALALGGRALWRRYRRHGL
jgi:Domain of unknown function (DUF4349)